MFRRPLWYNFPHTSYQEGYAMEGYKDPRLSPAERAADLLGRMTLREKVGQLTQRLYGFACYERRGEEILLTEEFRQEAERYGGKIGRAHV